MHKYITAGLAIVAAILLVILVSERQRAGKWEVRAAVVEAFAQRETARADSAVARADSLHRAAEELDYQLQVREHTVKSRVAAVRAEVAPDTCAPYLASRDAIIDEQASINEGLHQVIEKQRQAIAELKSGYTTVREVGDSLTAVVKDRPRQPSRVGVGVFAGYCIDGRPCAGVGVTWRIL